jgi:hypothetical protein
MAMIRDWGKKIVLVVNKIDVLPLQEVHGMRRFVEEQVQALLGLTSPIFMVSSRIGRRAKTAAAPGRERLMRESGFDELEGYVSGLMGHKDLALLKLLSPLGVAEELVRRYRVAAGERAKLLEEDVEMVRNLESLLESYREDTRRDFDVRMGHLVFVVNEINERGDTWFEENSGLKGSLGLFRRDHMQERFRQEVLAGTGEIVDKKVRELINWLVYRNVKQWRTIADYVELHRKADLSRRLAGEIADDFNNRREDLLRSVSDTATTTVENYDYRHEAQRLVESLREVAVRTAATEAGALGLEEAAAELVKTETLDITGTTLALLVSGLELSSRPGRKARSEFREQTNALRERLSEAVRRQLETDLEHAVQRMREAVIPYGNFVNSEFRRIKTTESILDKLGGGVETLGRAVDSPAAS